MRVHELHPSLVHTPLVLIPMATLYDLRASMKHRWRRPPSPGLWQAAALSGLVAGFTGLASANEVKAGDEHTRGMMYRHGAGNAAILAGTLAMATWRARRGPTQLQGAVGLLMSGALLYTAYLGGKMVYDHGVGVRGMPADAPAGLGHSPPLFSARAMVALARDGLHGGAWLARRTASAVTRALA